MGKRKILGHFGLEVFLIVILSHRSIEVFLIVSQSVLIAATTTLGIARITRACLPIRRGSSNRILPTPGDAIPSNGLPPRPPPGQYQPKSPNHRTTMLLPIRATHHSGFPGSPPTALLTISPSDWPVAITTDRTPEGAVG